MPSPSSATDENYRIKVTIKPPTIRKENDFQELGQSLAFKKTSLNQIANFDRDKPGEIMAEKGAKIDENPTEKVQVLFPNSAKAETSTSDIKSKLVPPPPTEQDGLSKMTHKTKDNLKVPKKSEDNPKSKRTKNQKKPSFNVKNNRKITDMFQKLARTEDNVKTNQSRAVKEGVEIYTHSKSDESQSTQTDIQTDTDVQPEGRARKRGLYPLQKVLPQSRQSQLGSRPTQDDPTQPQLHPFNHSFRGTLDLAENRRDLKDYTYNGLGENIIDLNQD